MPEQTPDRPPPGVASRTSKGGLSLLLPAVTFLVGLGLGVAVMWAGGAEDSTDVAVAPTTTQTTVVPTTTSSARPDATVTVPGSCLEVADAADEVADLVQDAAAAAQELDAAELSSIVRELQESQSELEQQSSTCRTDAGS